ncbi:MAG: serine/threonine protein kinase [Proteobacteria bacterium]|nr:serine/threonine protein kinase [Pseudomonadota bacterium]
MNPDDAAELRSAEPAERDPTTLVRPLRPGDAEATLLATQVQPRAAVDDDPDATVVRTLQRGAPLRPLPRQSLGLPKGLLLHEYRVERMLGQGGFGITYLATDVNLDAQVAIKEYLPEEIAFRAADRSVLPNASQHRERYHQGLENFLTEARTLASFRHPHIVRVARFFEAHDTAYMVMEYVRGRSFKTWWLRQKPQDFEPGHGERLLVQRMKPLLDGLAVVHAAGYLHRDIKPDNIQVRSEDGRLVLLDFGSAGQTVALADQDAVVVTPGYAPLEQYGIGEQGAWTDLYALAATLYWAVAGRKPPDAESRAGGLALQPAAEVGKGRYGRAFLEAIDWALQPDPVQRPRSVEAWRQRLLADHGAAARERADARSDARRAEAAHADGRAGEGTWSGRSRPPAAAPGQPANAADDPPVLVPTRPATWPWWLRWLRSVLGLLLAAGLPLALMALLLRPALPDAQIAQALLPALGVALLMALLLSLRRARALRREQQRRRPAAPPSGAAERGR